MSKEKDEPRVVPTRFGRPFRLRLYFWAIFVCAGAGSLIGFAGRHHWVAELFCHFRVQYLVLLLGYGLILGLRRSWGAAIVAIALATLNGVLVAPIYMRAPVVPYEGPTTRALLINVNRWNLKHAETIGYIRRIRPGFAVIQEVSLEWARSLEGLRDLYPVLSMETQENGFGIAFLCREEVDDVELRTVGSSRFVSVVARLRLQGRPLTVIGTHLPPPIGPWRAHHRQLQLQELGKFISRVPGPLMLLGDMNMTSWSPHFADLISRTRLVDSRQGRGLMSSWPTQMPLLWIPIDHCLATPDVAFLDRQSGPGVGSDHFPVVVDFALSGPVARQVLPGPAVP